MLNADCRRVILDRRCRADERGLFLSLPLAAFFDNVSEYGSNKIELIIFGFTHIGDSDVGQFYIEFYPGDYYFKHNDSFVREALLIAKCQGFKIDGKNTKMGLYLHMNPVNNCIDFYDAYYCRNLPLSEELLDNDKEVHIPFYLGNMYGNKIEGQQDSILFHNSMVYALDVEPSSRVIKGVIGERDAMYSHFNNTLFMNDKEMAKYITYIDQLIDSFSCTIDGKLYPTDKNNKFHNKYLKIKDYMKEIREIEQRTHSVVMIDRIFNKLEDIKTVQSEISEDVKKKNELLESVLELQHEILDEKYRLHKQKIHNHKNNNNCKYYCSMCLLIKNENNYLLEWLDHYESIGCDHYYIYDNGSTVPVKDYLASVRDGYYLDKCTIVDFSTGYKHMQYDCYENCLLNFGGETFWLGFVDTDEFIDVTCGNINTFLKDFEDEFCVWIPWELYASCGHVRKPEGLQKDNYTNPTLNPQGMFGKVILQPYRTKKMYVHLAIGYDQFDNIVNSDHSDNLINTLKVRNQYYEGDQSIYEFAKCRHYFTRSLEEWMDKISRGSCDPNFCRKFKTYFDFNPDMLNSEEAREFLEERQEYITYIQQSK